MNTLVKSGSQQKKSRRKRRKLLDHQDRRIIAKLIVDGMPRKQIMHRFNISASQLYLTEKGYVIVTLSERFPDQLSLNL